MLRFRHVFMNYGVAVSSLWWGAMQTYAQEPDMDVGVEEHVHESSADPVEEKKEDEGKEPGLLGPVRVGVHAGVAIPQPIVYGIDVMYEDWISVGFTTGKFSTNVDPAELQLAHWDIRARWFAFRSSFFVGLSYGKQTTYASATKDIDLNASGFNLKVPTTAQVDITTTYVTPHIGWLWLWDSGFNLGFELGLQMPMSSSADLDVAFKNVAPAQEETVKASKEYKDLEKKVDDIGKMFGKQVIPHITLLRMGWFF